MLRRFWRILSACLVALFILAIPVWAAFSADIAVKNTGSAYEMLGMSVPCDVVALASEGYITATGRDSRVQEAGADIPHMLHSNNIYFANELPASSNEVYQFVTGEVAQDMNIVPGYNGWYYTLDAPALEPSNYFEFDQSGYVDTTTYHGNQKLLYKQEAYVERVSSAGNITAGVISAESYDLGLTVDAAYQQKDVSDYVGTDANGVILEIITDGTPYQCAFRKTGSTDVRYYYATHVWVAVGLDSNYTFEYRIENAALDAYIRAYTYSGGGWNFNTNATDISLIGAGAWTNIDLSVGNKVPAGTEGVIIEVVETGTGTTTVGLRMDGSADARTSAITLSNHFWAIIGIDSLRVLEGWVGNLSVDFYLVGYITDGTTFFSNATDKSLGGIAAWTDIDCAVQAPNAKFVILETIASNAIMDYGYRKNGVTEARYQEMDSLHAWQVVETNYAQVFEGEISNLGVDTFLVGYVTSGVIHADCTAYTYSASLTSALASGEHAVKSTMVRCVDYDGVNGITNAGDVCDLGLNDFSLEFWLKTTDINSYFFAKNWNNPAWDFRTTIGGLARFYVGGLAIDSAVVVTDGTWHMIDVVADRSANGQVYVDGAASGAAVDISAIGDLDNTNDLTFASLWDGFAAQSPSDCDISEARIYIGHLLTAAEVAQHYDDVYTDESNLEGWWKFDDGAGATVSDYSGNNYDGTSAGGYAWDVGMYRLYVDNNLVDIDTGIAVPNSECAFEAALGNELSYTEYDIRDVGGVEVIKYQPVAIIGGEVYYTGTAVFINGVTGVTGAGTTWDSGMVGGLIRANTDGVWSVISSVTSPTALVLSANYTGAGGAAQTYLMMPRLPDRTGAAQDGTFILGSAPVGVTTTIGAITSDALAGGYPELDTGEAIGELEPPTDYAEPNPSAAGGSTELAPIVTAVGATTNTPSWFIWNFILLGGMVISFTLIYRATQHLWMAGFAPTAIAVVGCLPGVAVFSFWVPIGVVLVIAFFALSERETVT